MENRFGVKDFFVFLILFILVFMVALAMKQFDRQWDDIKTLSSKVDDQQRQLTEIHDSIGHGVTLNAPSTQSTGMGAVAVDDPFARLKAVHAMPGYAPGDWIIESFGANVAKLTPLLSGDAYAARVQGFVQESLASRDPDTLEYKPFLASSWKTQDNTAAYDAYVVDKKKSGVTDEQLAVDPNCPSPVVITFTMRPGTRFSDGAPLTADDVVFTFNFTMDPKIAVPRAKAFYKKIRKVEKVGADQVVFSFAEPYFQSFDMAASMPILPEHFYSKFAPEEFNTSVGFLMGSGPYRMVDPSAWKPGAPIELVRNEQYWGVHPAANKLIFREITNDIANLTAFRNGDIDLFVATPGQYVRMLKDQPLLDRTQHFEYLNPLGGYRFIAWNQLRDGKATRFADKRVRQAMAMLVDKQQMMQVCALGYAVEATGPFSPVSKQCDPAINEWAYDVAHGKQLLADAGFSKTNSQGLLVGPDDKVFSFKLTYPSGNASIEQMILFLKDSYAKVGIELIPDPLQWAVFTDRLGNKNFDTICLGWTAGIENDVYQMFDSANAGPGGDNFMSYKNPEFDQAVEQARRTIDENARMPLWRKAHAIIHDDQPYFFLWFGKTLAFMDKRIQNVHLTRLGLDDRSEWFVPAAQQHWGKP